ncbi:MAG: hypothetical protein CYG59_03395 [Chloroflexi bacterium]|nr:MAG: hypothetical protein CYG59_03395 [Chloroflexota bacterium]
MQSPIGRPLHVLATWLGGWFRLLLLGLAIVGVLGGLLWERQRRPPLPPTAEQVTSQLAGDLRQTSFRYPGTVAEVRDFYQQAFAQRGWRYCGTQAIENCSNMISLAGRSEQEIDVYRAAGDQDNRGPTIEIWPQRTETGEIYVTVFETRGR